MRGCPEAKHTRPAYGQGSTLIYDSIAQRLRLAVALVLLADVSAPAAARPYLDKPPAERLAPDGGSTRRHETGLCQVGREWSQSRNRLEWPHLNGVRSGDALGYMGQAGVSQAADLAEARMQVERVVRVSGLEMNFEMIIAPSTPAAAQIINGQRVILFDPHFMAHVADRICPDWGATSILAHEVGHHLSGHTLRQSSEPWRDELEADEFSGFVLARLGATQAEAISAATRILPEQATSTHPGRTDRIAAIVHGWQNAKALLGTETAPARSTRGLVPMPQIPYNSNGEDLEPSNLAISARIILYNDPNDYYITKSGRIDAYDGVRRPIARKSIPNSANYAWSFHSDGLRLNVDYNGLVSIRLPSGIIVEVGLVVPIMPQVASGN